MASPLKGFQEFIWSPNLGASGAYINAKGRRVAELKVQAQLRRVIKGVESEMIDISKQLQNGDIMLQEWYDAMRPKKRIIHGLSGSLARGGVERMTPTDWGRVGGLTKADYGRLDKFAKALEDGLPLDGNFLNRVRLHAKAGITTYNEVKRGVAKGNGFNEERRVLGNADHCETQSGLTGCKELARMGWVLIGTLPAIGRSPCHSNCQCHFEYRMAPSAPATQGLLSRLVNMLRLSYG